MALFRRSYPVVLTAAASRILDPQDPSARSKAPDAAYLYSLYSELGPVHAALRSKFQAASKITYFPAVIENPDEDPVPIDDGPAREAYDRLQGPNGDFGNFVAEMALHWEIPGEGYLVGQNLDGDEEWDIWSPVEYDENRQGLRSDLDDDAAKAIKTGDFIMRSWRAHPMKRSKPDSGMRGVVRQCEQYIAFSDMLTSLAQSRLVAPLVITPSEMDFPTTDDNGNAQTFGSWLNKAMSAAVSDPRNANRITPISIEVPFAFADGVKTVDLTRDIQEWVPEVMERILRQIAIGLDIPAEILTGLADVNHWGQWLIDDSLRLNYVDPLVLDVLDSFTRGYLWPALQAAGVEDFDRYLFWRDYSDLTSRSVTAADALASFEAQIISASAARRTIGFTEGDAPDESDPVPTQTNPLVEVQGIPDTLTAASPPPSLAAIDHRLFTQLAEAAQASLDRALEKAGQRVRSQIRGDSRRSPKDPLAMSIQGLDPIIVPFTVGRATVETLQLSEEDLIPEGAFDRFSQRAKRLLTEGQAQTRSTLEQLTGIKPEAPPEEDNWITAALAGLVGGLIGLARRRLFTPDLEPDPAETGEVGSTDIPASLVFDGMTVAGGGVPGDFNTRGLATGEYGQNLITTIGFQVEERQWSVGAPTVPFEPHQHLNGFRFTSWTDPRLKPPLSAAWLGVDFMHPSDHRGCVCIADLVVVPIPQEQVA